MHAGKFPTSKKSVGCGCSQRRKSEHDRRPSDVRGNQARLRRLHAQYAPPTPVASGGAPPKSASGENVWGFLVDASMCGCKASIGDSIGWANTAAATYKSCDTAANATGEDVEKCFEKAQPGSIVEATTDASGTMTLPPTPTDPCGKIDHKATAVHETMHARHTDELVRAQGSAVFDAWRKLAGDPKREDKVRALFPKEMAAFDTQWDSGSDWARDEIHSYTWERRFYQDALATLNRICTP